MNGVISRVTRLISHIRGLITPHITTHEPPNGVGALHIGFRFLARLQGLGLASTRSLEAFRSLLHLNPIKCYIGVSETEGYLILGSLY